MEEHAADVKALAGGQLHLREPQRPRREVRMRERAELTDGMRGTPDSRKMRSAIRLVRP